MNHTLAKDQKAFAFDPTIPPVLTVAPGDTITFETGDFAYERLANGEAVEAIGLENFNAVTGPVYVTGAEPGDALAIEILDVQVTRAWSVWLPGFGGLGAKTDALHVMETPLREGRAHLTADLSVPIEPMIGCIGLAPQSGKASTYMPSYFHGGNFDLREMMAGATLYLPVQVPGALLALGDLHAAMGTGEPTWVSLEAAGSATVRVSVEKGKALTFPRLKRDGATFCFGMGDSLEAAHQAALDHAYGLLIDECGLEPFAAYAYASARVAMRFGGPASPLVLAVVPDLAS